ncbi:hypothetical protein D9M68_865530 [compost metagenome]
MCFSSGDRSDTPVTLVPEGSQFFTSLAATGSVMAEYTTGMVLVAATVACADGVAMATITSGASPTYLRAIWAAVPTLPWALW